MDPDPGGPKTYGSGSATLAGGLSTTHKNPTVEVFLCGLGELQLGLLE